MAKQRTVGHGNEEKLVRQNRVLRDMAALEGTGGVAPPPIFSFKRGHDRAATAVSGGAATQERRELEPAERKKVERATDIMLLTSGLGNVEHGGSVTMDKLRLLAVAVGPMEHSREIMLIALRNLYGDCSFFDCKVAMRCKDGEFRRLIMGKKKLVPKETAAALGKLKHRDDFLQMVAELGKGQGLPPEIADAINAFLRKSPVEKLM